MARASSTRSILSSLFSRPSTTTRLRKHDPLLTMIEELEDRRLLATGSDPFVIVDSFNQFTGNSPTVFGFGVTDLSPENADGHVSPDPKFLGLSQTNQSIDFGGIDYSGFGSEGDIGAQLIGTLSYKIGLNVGFYVNTGTATLLHDGTFSYDAEPPTTSNGPITINTAMDVASGSVYTQSPEISAYVDLVVDVTFVGAFQFAVPLVTDGVDSVPLNINTNNTLPLASINRQVADANGNPETNPDGTPIFDGTVESVGYDIFHTANEITDKIQEAQDKTEQGMVDEAKAGMEQAEGEKAAAQADMTTGEGEVSDGQQEKTSDDADSGSLQDQTFGQLITASFGPATGGLLGLQASLNAGFAEGVVDVGETLGTLAVTLPDIDLSGQQDASGNINASTDDFTPGSTQDTNRQAVALTINPTAVIPVLGAWDVSVPGVDVSGSILTYNITTALNVDQTVAATPGSVGSASVAALPENQVTFQFTDATTGAPVIVTPTVGGVAQAPSSSITFTAGESLQIQPPQDFTDSIVVTPSLTQNFTFSNDIGLDLEILGQLSILQATVSIAGQDLPELGPAYMPDPNVILSPQKLGTIFSTSFPVSSPAMALSPFDIAIPYADVAVALSSGPPPQIDATYDNPNPSVDYTVTVTNYGPDIATNVVLNDILPSQLGYTNTGSTSGVQGGPGLATLTIPSLGVGQSMPVTIDANYDSVLGGTASSSFSVTADESDPNLSNNNLPESTFVLTPVQIPGPGEFVTTEAGLRSAVAQVDDNSYPLPPEIFISPQADITLTPSLGELDITSSVVIVGGPDSLADGGYRAIIDGGGVNGTGIFNFTGNQQQAYRLENLILENGNGAGTDGYGGAISIPDGGTLTIVGSSIETNTALTGGGAGGAVYAVAGALILDDDDISGNQATVGGGLYLADETTTLTDVSMTGNSATGEGSAIEQISTPDQATLSTIQDSTFFNNQGSSGGGSIDNAPDAGSLSSTVTYEDSIFSTSATGGASAAPNFSGESAGGIPATLTSLGNNIASDGTGNLTAAGDQPNTQAGLFLSGTQIASGQSGYTVGTLSLVWTNVVGTVIFSTDSDGFIVDDGNILSLQAGQSYDTSNDTQETVSITATDATGNGVGPNNTNFQLQVVPVPQAPTSITVTSPNGINENTSVPAGPGVLGVPIGSVAVVDPDGSTSFTFLVDDPRFQVAGNATSGYNLYLKPGLSLAYLNAATIPIQITATSAAGLSFTSLYRGRQSSRPGANADRSQQLLRPAQHGWRQRGPTANIRSQRPPHRGEHTRRVHVRRQRPTISSGQWRTGTHAGPNGSTVGVSHLSASHLNRRQRSLRDRFV